MQMRNRLMVFVRNSWYMAAWSGTVGAAPIAITIANEPIVIFRTGSGVSALYDVCPHRAVPLSLGHVAGETIVCPYHGIAFDGGGICRKNPHVKGPPERLKTRAYPVAERDGIIWVWTGDQASADINAIPDYSWFDTPSEFATARGYLHVEADYRLVIDNLMDLAHADYIHANTVGQPGAAEVQQAAVVRDGKTISVNTMWPDLPPSAFHRQAWTKTERVDKYLDMKWQPVSNLLLDLGVMAPGDPRKNGIRTPGAHILTPETERTTHYFWASSRDFKLDDTALTARIGELIGTAFGSEDKPIIEAAQRNIERTGATLRNLTTGDSGSALVRRELDRLATQEQATTVPA